MYKVLIVDDELLVRTNLKMLIDWNKEDLHLCGEANNGIDALSQIKIKQPNIVITDMLMPKMSGLELCKSLSDNHDDIVIIALSNSDDYDFVRGSLKYGAIDYLLKNQLSTENLSTVISRAKESLKTKKNHPSPLSYPDNLSDFKRNYIMKLLSHTKYNDQEMKEVERFLDINISEKNITPIVASIDSFNLIVNDSSIITRESFISRTTQLVEGIISEKSDGIVSYLYDDLFILLIFSPKDANPAIQMKSLLILLKQISSVLEKFLDISASFSVGNFCLSKSDLSASFEEAEKSIKSKFFLGNSSIIMADSKVTTEDKFIQLNIEHERAIAECIQISDISKIETILVEIFSNIKSEKVSLKHCEVLFNELIGIVNKTAKSKSIDLENIYTHDISSYKLILKSNTLEDIYDWFYALFYRLIDEMDNEIHSNNYSSYVSKAVILINKKYTNEITLDMIAEEIGISSSYLSTKFKKELSVSFTSYVTDLRMKKALIFIKSGETNLKSIGIACGFHDYNYFLKQFKNHTGMTPKNYKKQLLENRLNKF